MAFVNLRYINVLNNNNNKSTQLHDAFNIPQPYRGWGIKRYCHPSVCPSPRRAAALGYRHAVCLQLSHVRTADPSADGSRSAASRTTVGGGGHIGLSSRRPRGDNLYIGYTGISVTTVLRADWLHAVKLGRLVLGEYIHVFQCGCSHC